MTVRIEVTQRDIDRAKAMQESAYASDDMYSFDGSCNCPIALAAKRKMRKQVSVFDDASISVGRSGRKYQATKSCQVKAGRLINNFDARNYDKCRPIVIEIEPDTSFGLYDE